MREDCIDPVRTIRDNLDFRSKSVQIVQTNDLRMRRVHTNMLSKISLRVKRNVKSIFVKASWSGQGII